MRVESNACLGVETPHAALLAKLPGVDWNKDSEDFEDPHLGSISAPPVLNMSS